MQVPGSGVCVAAARAAGPCGVLVPAVLPVVPIVGIDGWLLLWPPAPVVEVVLLCWPRTVESGAVDCEDVLPIVDVLLRARAEGLPELGVLFCAMVSPIPSKAIAAR